MTGIDLAVSSQGRRFETSPPRIRVLREDRWIESTRHDLHPGDYVFVLDDRSLRGVVIDEHGQSGDGVLFLAETEPYGDVARYVVPGEELVYGYGSGVESSFTLQGPISNYVREVLPPGDSRLGSVRDALAKKTPRGNLEEFA